MISEFEVYCAFRKAQANAISRPYKLPKDGDTYFEEKLKPEQREAIRKMSRYLLTTGSNIDIHKYFKYGFEIGKSFTYHQGFKSQLINYYIQKEKNQKLLFSNLKKDVIKSAKFIKLYIKENEILSLKQYARIREDFQYIAIQHYIKNHICIHLLTYLIYKKYLILDNTNKDQIPLVIQKYREIRFNIIDEMTFFNEIEKILTN